MGDSSGTKQKPVEGLGATPLNIFVAEFVRIWPSRHRCQSLTTSATSFHLRRLQKTRRLSVAATLRRLRCVTVFFQIAFVVSMIAMIAVAPQSAHAEFQAGAAIVDVTPRQLPVIVNGGILSNSADRVHTRLMARALVLDDGGQRVGIVVVDSCIMPRPLLDEVKRLAAQRTKIRPDRMLISATHTHTAPSVFECLGTNADPTYVPYLREMLAQSLAKAEANLEPARVGWGVRQAAEFTALRRWIRRPDRIADDPFGNPTVRANMHAGSNLDDVTGESGPEDPDLSFISIQSKGGRPLALLANFSMHYYTDQALSADYFGLFCNQLQDRLGHNNDTERPPLVAIMSHGCSGDIWRHDYSQGKKAASDINDYSQRLANLVVEAYDAIEYQEDVDLSMAETRFNLKYRVPNQQRLEWAQEIVAKMGDRLPENTSEVYAREQVVLHQRQSTEVVVQALRIGNIGIATTPCETYAITGLKLKLQSPLDRTMVIELANGGDGYIPPPEQHVLGGYNTWAARSAGLEKQAEPKITEMALGLLEQVAEKPRRRFRQSQGHITKNILKLGPVAYWRLDELAGPRAVDSSGHHCDGSYEDGVVFFLAGPVAEGHCAGGEQNRAAHFAGGRLRSRIPELTDYYTVAMWFWNGIPVDGRPVAGWLFSRDHDYGLSHQGDHVGVGGTLGHAGKLIFMHGQDQEADPLHGGRTAIERWTWNHLAFVREGEEVRVYLNGNPQPEINVRQTANVGALFDQLFVGGRSDSDSNWEGRLDEVAVFDRALTGSEIARLVH